MKKNDKYKILDKTKTKCVCTESQISRNLITPLERSEDEILFSKVHDVKMIRNKLSPKI